MTIRIQQQDPAAAKIQFVLPADVHDGAVSVVGSFNDWSPGVHRLVRRSNGTRSVSVAVPRGQEVRFRYLGNGGGWVDDPDAHEITCAGPVFRLGTTKRHRPGAWSLEARAWAGCTGRGDRI